jgi:hypothetical protein
VSEGEGRTDLWGGLLLLVMLLRGGGERLLLLWGGGGGASSVRAIVPWDAATRLAERVGRVEVPTAVLCLAD